MANTPNIRFAGFTDAWEQRKLGDAVDVCSGKDYKHLDEGEIPVYGTGGYMLSVSEALSQYDAIGIGRKGTIDNPYILRAPFWTVDTLFYCVPKNSDLNFVYALYQTINWRSMDESTGVPSLSKTAINDVDIHIPSVDEQHRIGELFNILDETITLHQRKCEDTKNLKKYMLKKMFPQNGTAFPEIRFSGFTDAWEQRKLGDVLSFVKDGTHGTHPDASEGPLLLSAKNIKNGCINWDESDRRISQHEFEKIHSTFHLMSGDVLMTIVGSIGEAAILKEPENITFQRSVAFLRPNENITSEFLYSEIQTSRFQKDLDSRKSTSAQPGIYLGDLSEMPFSYPSDIHEQKQIGAFILKMEDAITLHQRKCDELKSIKKYMLQNMFPQKG